MTGMIRKATLLVALGLVAASAAMAGIPSPANCTFASFIDVVATNGVVADPYGTYTVTVKDVANNACPGSIVTLNFLGSSDIRLATDFAPAGQVNTCNVATVTTNGSGVATFIVVGAAKNNGGLVTGGGAGGMTVRADGYVLGTVTAAVYDQNGANNVNKGVDVTDLSAWLTDSGLFGGLGNPGYKGRSDYNHNGQIDVVDLSYWLTLSGSGTSAVGGTYCP
jgi:hypothetical protein